MAATNNPVRFGISIGNPPFHQLVAISKAAEEAGFDTIAFSDRPPENNLEAWTLATYIGAVTQRVILTHSTLNVPFRNPALLAKMASSLDVMTGGGRVQLTLGAGGQEQHYQSYGIPFGTPGERFQGLRDAVTIMRGLWSNKRFTYHGRTYQVEDAEALPKPVLGTIPIWIGAGGPQMMAYTGRVADGWMKNRGWPTSLDELRTLVQQLEEGAEKAGRDPRAIRRVLNGGGVIGDSAAEVEKIRQTIDPQNYLAVQGLMGTAEQVLELVNLYRENGVDTFHLRIPPQMAVEQIQRFGRDVLPKVRRESAPRGA